jgi:two-component system KDP operon response regulator KdpE
MSQAKILVVDDEPQIRRAIKAGMDSQNYCVADARSGEEALARLRQERYDLILLDREMPGIGGLEACRQIRSAAEVAVIMLTTHNGEFERIEALDAGAYDCVTKPFSMPELLARIRANLRRVPTQKAADVVAFDGIEVNLGSRRVLISGRDIHLRPKEFDVLRYLIANPNAALSHGKILQAVWGPDYRNQTEYLHVIMNQIRGKIEPDPARPRYIVTEPRIGYRFRVPAGKTSAALETESDLCRQLVENIDPVCWVFDVRKDHFVYFSPAFEKVSGRSSSEYLTPASLLEVVHAEDRDCFLRFFGTRLSEPAELSYRIVRPDGSVRWIHSRRFPVRDPEGKIYRRAGFALDITAQREAEEHLR